MRSVDFSPLYRSTIGFDRLSQLLDSVTHADQNQPSYPPYNIVRLSENDYLITMAVAGFSESEIDITTERSTLTVSGKKDGSKDESQEELQYLHKGIAARNFQRQFQLADHVNVIEAKLENGLLNVTLQREIPEAMKPRKITISSGALEDKQVA